MIETLIRRDFATDIDGVVKVSIRPFQESELLPSKVISKW